MGLCEPWATDADLCCVLPPPVGDGEDAVPDPIIATAIEVASEVLWVLSGRQHGVCSRTIRPSGPECPREPWPSLALGQQSRPSLGSAAAGGLWAGYAWPGCAPCGRGTSSVRLRGRVLGVTEVRLGGDLVDRAGYRLRGRRLYRVGGTWPLCQNPDADPTDPAYLTVTYLRGRPVPKIGTQAVAEMACELIKACSGSECKLPKRVQTITRQGLTMTLLDPMDFLDKGKTGLYWCDLFLSAYNPRKLQRGARGYTVADVRGG